MKKTLFSALLLISFSANAQDSRKFSLKVYSQVQHSSGVSSIDYGPNDNGPNTYVIRSFQETKLSLLPGIKWQVSPKTSHELSLTGLDWERKESLTEVAVGESIIPVGENNFTEFTLGLRYEFGYSLPIFQEESKFNVEVGLGASPTYYTIKHLPFVSNVFPSKNSNLDLNIQLIPRLTYSLNENWYLDFNVPFNGVAFRYEMQKVENPAFSSDQQKQTSFSLDGLPSQYEVRLGLGYNL